MKFFLNALHSDSVISEMATGNVSPAENGVFNDPFLRSREQEMDEAGNTLLASLTEEQQALFAAYRAISDDIRGIREEATFTYAFKLGARTMQEILQDAQ